MDKMLNRFKNKLHELDGDLFYVSKLAFNKIKKKIFPSNFNLARFSNSLANQLEVKMKRGFLLSRPIVLSIEPSNRCNSYCMMCAHVQHRKNKTILFGDMAWETFDRTRPFWKYANEIVLGGNGEPFLNTNYLRMAQEIKKEGCFVHTFTNGLLLDEKISNGLVNMQYDLINLSMGGSTPGTYNKVRGVDGYDNVVANLKRLKKIKRAANSDKPVVNFNIAAMNTVLSELNDIVELAAELDVASIDMFHLLVYFNHVRPESPWLNQDLAKEQMEKAREKTKRYGVRLSLPDFDQQRETFCRHPFSQIFIQWNGDVTVCSSLRFIFGNINDQPINKIWNSKAWRETRKQIKREGYTKVCPHCPSWQVNNRDLILNVPMNCGDLTTDFRAFEMK